jgi:hypothetical protein
MDVLLQRLANGSQLGVLVLAVFGYFYTVLPVYQKSLLDEAIAKKTLQLNAMETRITATEALLAARESEFNGMNKKIGELRAAAATARQGLGQAKAEVGKLRGAVELQYSELRPRLFRDFQALAIAQCKLNTIPDGGFADCVESKVLPSPVLSSLEGTDRGRLLRIVREHNATIQKSWSDFSAGIEQRKREVERKKKDAQLKCEQLKSGNDYGDKMKKISIDYQCSVDLSQGSSDLFKIAIDELYSNDKVFSPALSLIARDFFAVKP